MAYFGFLNPPMAQFHGLYHGNCDLGFVGGIFELVKLEFRGLKGQFDVKKANFRGLIAKIGYLRLTLTSKTHLGPFSWNMPWELCHKVCWRDFRVQKFTF